MGKIDALMIRQRAADQTLGLGEILAAIEHFEAHLAIVDQQLVAGAQRREHFGMRQRRAMPVADPLGEIEAEMVARRELGLAAGEIAEAQLWPLHVGENADRPPGLVLDLTD